MAIAESSAEQGGGRRARGGAEARRHARNKPKLVQNPFIRRNIPLVTVLDEEGLALMEHNADTILQETGIEFRDEPEALELWKKAGADVKGTRIRFPKGLPRSIIQKSAPREYVQYARNPERNVTIGGNNTVFAPVYGPPFIRNLDEGRRYATIEDFRNFVKLAYMSPSIHHSGGTVCEPVDLPVNKRHLDMVYSHIRYSDKPFMSPVTVAGTLAQVLAEVLTGAATAQLVRPGAPVIFGVFASSISMQSGAPTFGTPEPTLVLFAAAQL